MTSPNDISTDVARFLRETVMSVATLEMLLLLRNSPGEAWSIERLSREMRIEAAWTSEHLQRLQEAGLLILEPGPAPAYRYRPRSPELESLVTAVSQAYILHRVRVIELMYSPSNENIQAFADAFKFKRGPRDG